MKKNAFFIFLIFSLVFKSQAQKTAIVDIVNFRFFPDTTFIYTGDNVTFNVQSDHTATQVSKDVYKINEAYPLTGGFDIIPSSDLTITFNMQDTIYYVCKPHAGAGMKGIVIIESRPLGISEELKTSNGLSIFPNPANNYIIIQFPENGIIKNIKLTDVNGIELEHFDINKAITSFQIPTSSLKKGTYQVLTYTSTSVLTGKVLICD